ncbi:MAG: hypothetical protein ACXIU8_09395 [Alkalilacustris sp.]
MSNDEVSFDLPDVGVPGSATPGQVAAIEKLIGGEVGFPLSREQAHIILDAREYARAILERLRKEGAQFDETATVRLVAYIANDEPLRAYVCEWGRGRFGRGTHGETPRLRRNDHFHKVVEHAGRLAKNGPLRSLAPSTRSPRNEAQSSGSVWKVFKKLFGGR